MAKLTTEINTMYDKGDIVVFNYHGVLRVGMVVGYYVDAGAGMSVWYNMAVSPDCTLSYSNGGDIAEFDILCKISESTDNLYKICNFIQNGKTED